MLSTSWGKGRQEAKMHMKNGSRDLPACSLTELACCWLDQHYKSQLSEQEYGQSQEGWERKNLYLLWPLNVMGREGLAQPFNDTQFSSKEITLLSRGMRQVATKVLLRLWYLLPPSPQRTSSNGWAQNITLCSNVFAPFGLPAAALEYIFQVVHCSNRATKLQATCSIRTAQLGTEECVRNIIKSDLSRQFPHKTHWLPQTETKAALRQAAAGLMPAVTPASLQPKWQTEEY